MQRTVRRPGSGVRGAPQFDNANNIYFRARIVAGSTQFQLFKATPLGVRTVFSLAGDPDQG